MAINSLATSPPTAAASASEKLRDLLDALDDAFGHDFHVIDVESGSPIHWANDLPRCESACPHELLAAATRTGQAQLVADEDAVVVLALPMARVWNLPWVVYAPFATRAMRGEPLTGAAQLLGQTEEQTRHWINGQTHWPVRPLELLGREFLRRLKEQRRALQLELEVDKVSSSLATSYEEISLLHSISQNFRLSSSDEELGRLALGWLCDCIPTQGIALLYLPVAKQNDTTYQARTEPVLLASGDCAFATAEEALALVEQVSGPKPGASTRNAPGSPLVVNHNRVEYALPEGIRQLIIAPMVEGERVLGYLLACNHHAGEEFGTVEANLLSSVASMLGVHCSNRDLYRQHDEFLASVVRALTSAIDAKDPYTCGHSDRVARVATRIAKQLGCEKAFLDTIYMAGLLHDIGKIGIDDAVLRKPGRLTEGEFQHIKQHPALGYKILADIKQFSSVLPAVLHHHEQWDGAGYPCQLAGEHIPFIARIVAVADAYDAMTSDRPYRPGMPEEKVQRIFREGAGVQWDADVIAAFQDCYDDIRTIVKAEQASLSLDVQQWLV